jgi:hypothetical protein
MAKFSTVQAMSVEDELNWENTLCVRLGENLRKKERKERK